MRIESEQGPELASLLLGDRFESSVALVNSAIVALNARTAGIAQGTAEPQTVR